jgi:hypothetical protein
MTAHLERLAERARAIRSRAAVRRWELRQLHHAAGAWHRLSRRLALTRRAWVIDDDVATALLAAGQAPDPAGLAFEPPLRWFVLSDAHVRTLAGAREIALQASPELLACRNLALVPFAGSGASGGGGG